MMKVIDTIDEKFTQALEYSEADYWSKLYESSTSLKSYRSVIADAYACCLPEIDTLAMNRVVGLGMKMPVQIKDIDDIVNFFKKAGAARFFVQVSPFAGGENLVELLGQKGFRHHNNWTKLYRKVDSSTTQTETSLQIELIDQNKAHLYGKIIFKSFDWQDERLAEWLATSVGKPGYRQYLVYHRGKPIAAGALHIMNEYGSMSFAGTLPEYRGLGAQSLLLETRIREAKANDCRYVVSETAEELPDKPVISFRNMVRFGFNIAYKRQNWIYEF